MESASQITEWIEYAKRSLGLKIIQFTWPSRFNVDLVDFEFSMAFGSQTVRSRGTHIQVEGAFARAISELVERVTILANGLTSSNGVAAHPCKIEASKFAQQELYERLICEQSYIYQAPVYLASSYELNGMSVCQYLIDPSTAMVLIEGNASAAKPFHLCVGHACRENQQHAVDRATMEALRTAAWLTLGEANPRSAECDLGRFWDTNAKYVLGFNAEYAEKVIQSFVKRRAGQPGRRLIMPKVKLTRLTIPSHLKVNWLTVVKASRVD